MHSTQSQQKYGTGNKWCLHSTNWMQSIHISLEIIIFLSSIFILSLDKLAAVSVAYSYLHHLTCAHTLRRTNKWNYIRLYGRHRLFTHCCVCVWMSLCWLSKFDAVPHQQQLLLWTAKYRSFVFFSFSCCHFHMHSWKYSSVPAQLPLLFRRCTFVIIESTITQCDDCCSSRHHHRQANAIIIMIDWTVKYLYVFRCCAEWFIHLPIV